MVCMHKKVNFADAELFKKSPLNAVLISTLEIIKMHQKKNRTTLPRCGPKGWAR